MRIFWDSDKSYWIKLASGCCGLKIFRWAGAGVDLRGVFESAPSKHFFPLIRLDFKCSPPNQPTNIPEPQIELKHRVVSFFTKLDQSKSEVSVSREQTFALFLSQSRSRTGVSHFGTANPEKANLHFLYENVTYIFCVVTVAQKIFCFFRLRIHC